MIAGLFAVQLILAALVIFTTYMISNKFKNIEESLELYVSSRAYKTQSDIAFIERVLTRYKEGIENIGEEVDAESLIKAVLYKEYIGKFPFLSIKNIAVKTSRLIWGIILVEGIIAAIDPYVNTASAILIIAASVLVAIGAEMFKFIKGIEEEKETLIMLVQDYIVNIYPIEISKKYRNKEVMDLKIKVSELEREIEAEEKSESAKSGKTKQEKIVKDELSIQDIAKLIGIFQ